LSRSRDRALFFAIVIILLALTVLRSALHLAGAAIRVIVIVALIFFVIAWVTSKVGRAR